MFARSIFTVLILAVSYFFSYVHAVEFRGADYQVYTGDVNGDGIDDVYLKVPDTFVPIHGDILTPLYLDSAVPSYLIASANDDFPYYLEAVIDESIDVSVLTKNTELSTLEDVNDDGVLDLTISGGQTLYSITLNGDLLNPPIIIRENAPSHRVAFPTISPTENIDDVSTNVSHAANTPLVGQFDVDNNGNATYKLPFQLPPSINGSAPDLGVLYSSGSDRSDLRVGWSIYGIGEISRCAPTKIKDGFVAPVKLDAAEKQRFCYNGQPLILVSGGVYGSEGTEYVTQIHSGLRFKAFGQAGNGPDYFMAKTADGSSMLFGSESQSFQRTDGLDCCEFGSGSKVKSSNSDTILTWRLDSITDQSGNSFSYYYHTSVPEFGSIGSGNIYSSLSLVRYKGNVDSNDPDIEIQFNWEESVESYLEWYTFGEYSSVLRYNNPTKEISSALSVDGLIIVEPYKLENVTVRVAGDILREYNFSYQEDEFTNKRFLNSNLSSIQECNHIGDCKLPVTFEWEEKYRDEQAQQSSCQYTPSSETVFPGGQPAFADSYEFSQPYTTNFGWGGGNHWSHLLGDFNGDELADIAVVYTYRDGDESKIKANLAYSNGDGTFSAAGNEYQASIGGPILNHRLSGDLNNDGYADLVATNSDSDGWRSYVMLNNGDGTFADPIYKNLTDQNFIKDNVFQKTLGDFNGDGDIDLMLFGIGRSHAVSDQFSSAPAGLEAWVALGDGEGNFQSAVGGRLLEPNEVADFENFKRRLFTGDFNGDGITDIGSIYLDTEWEDGWMDSVYRGGEIIVAFGRESGLFDTPIVHRIPPSELPENWSPFLTLGFDASRTTDVNGDGITDIIAIEGTWDSFKNPARKNDSGEQFANPDYVVNRIFSWISRADGTFEMNEFQDVVTWDELNSENANGCSYSSAFPQYVVQDFNNDGFADIYIGSERMYLGRGNGSFLKQGGKSVEGDNFAPTGGGQTVDSFFVNDTTYGVYGFDVNRDGNSDLVEIVVDGGGLKVGTLAYAENVNQQYLAKITDGYGREIDISYSSIMDPSVYSVGESVASSAQEKAPFNDFRVIKSGKTVVKSVEMSDGIGDKYETSYFYTGLLHDLTRRELLGFESISKTDSRNGITTVSELEQVFPYTGREVGVSSFLNDDTLISKRTYDWSSRAGGSYFDGYSDFVWWFVYKTAEEQINYNDDGSYIGKFSTEYSNFDEFRNPELIVIERSDGNETKIEKVIENNDDWDNFYLNRTKSKITSARTSHFDPYDKRTVSYSYYSNGLIESRTLEPELPNLYLRTEFSYDSYGRVEMVEQQGHPDAEYPVETRIEEFRYVHPTSSEYSEGKIDYQVINTNSEGHETTTSFDVKFGNKRNLVDENDLEFSWEYDLFGELLVETRPDETVSTYSKSLCDSSCPENAVSKLLARSTGQADVESYYDLYGRELRKRTIGFGGKEIYQDFSYDAFGRRVYESEPYFSIDGAGRASTTTYDELGREEDIYSPEEGQRTLKYEATGLGTGTKIITTIHREGFYNSGAIELEQFIDLGGKTTKSVNSELEEAKFVYDGFGQLIRVVDPESNLYHIEYDELGRRIGIIDPDLGSREFGFDAFGLVRYEKDANLQEFYFQYDKLGRMTQKSKPEGLDSWTYDLGYKSVGKVVHESSASGVSKAFAYDEYSRLMSETYEIHGEAYNYQHAYDAAGRYQKVTYPTDYAISYGYDVYGNINVVYAQIIGQSGSLKKLMRKEGL